MRDMDKIKERDMAYLLKTISVSIPFKFEFDLLFNSIVSYLVQNENYFVLSYKQKIKVYLYLSQITFKKPRMNSKALEELKDLLRKEIRLMLQQRSLDQEELEQILRICRFTNESNQSFMKILNQNLEKHCSKMKTSSAIMYFFLNSREHSEPHFLNHSLMNLVNNHANQIYLFSYAPIYDKCLKRKDSIDNILMESIHSHFDRKVIEKLSFHVKENKILMNFSQIFPYIKMRGSSLFGNIREQLSYLLTNVLY